MAKVKKLGGFVNATEFFWMLTQYRNCFITGRYGSGKTLLAVALAYELWERNYIDWIHSNFPLAAQTTDPTKNTDFVMLLDEAHVILDSREFSRNASKDWLKDLRKRNSILIIPAVLEVDKRFRSVVVARKFMVGNLLWVYQWEMSDAVGTHGGWFALTHPYRYFNLYPTEYIVRDEDFDMMHQVMTGEVKELTKNEEVIHDFRQTVSVITDEGVQFQDRFDPRDITVGRIFNRR